MSNHIENPADNHVHESSQEKSASLQEWIAEVQKLQKENLKYCFKPATMHDLPQMEFSEKRITGRPYDRTDFVKAERRALEFCRKSRPSSILTTTGKEAAQVHERKPPEEHNIQASASQTVECIDPGTVKP